MMIEVDTDAGDLEPHRKRHTPAPPPPRKIIDMHLPLAWLLSGMLSFALLIGGMYFQIGQLSKDLAELKTAVNTGNSQSASTLGDLAILKYRVDSLEKKEAHDLR
jgi:hypothetical protein